VTKPLSSSPGTTLTLTRSGAKKEVCPRGLFCLNLAISLECFWEMLITPILLVPCEQELHRNPCRIIKHLIAGEGPKISESTELCVPITWTNGNLLDSPSWPKIPVISSPRHFSRINRLSLPHLCFLSNKFLIERTLNFCSMNVLSLSEIQGLSMQSYRTLFDNFNIF